MLHAGLHIDGVKQAHLPAVLTARVGVALRTIAGGAYPPAMAEAGGPYVRKMNSKGASAGAGNQLAAFAVPLAGAEAATYTTRVLLPVPL